MQAAMGDMPMRTGRGGVMDTEAKHGLPKVIALADKLARLVLDQIEKDGCGNLENIRNALVGPLAQDEMDRHHCKAKARQQWEGAAWRAYDLGVKGPVGPIGPSAPDDAVMGHKLWCRDGDIDLRPSRHLLKAFGDAIASCTAQRVSINDGTYVLPDGEVLSELEMIKRGGTDGRR